MLQPAARAILFFYFFIYFFNGLVFTVCRFASQKIAFVRTPLKTAEKAELSAAITSVLDGMQNVFKY